ncbi:tetratricopeptide repeat protein [Kitasatospora sp. NPDC049285]|uniref:ATP-binding protein n=1 Tax=Kitasatospora sp. NPDC049285 TaxID=3157096 RepID=UPI003432D607
MADAINGAPPDPLRAADLAEFIGLLGELRRWAGQPSYRVLAARTGPLLRPPRTVSAFTVVDAFKPGRRRLDLDLVVGIVRALGLGESEVAQWREACLAVHATAKSGGSSGVFRQLPADLATFTGRDRVVREVMAAATGPGRRAATVVISAIEGMAGVGKTRLAVHVAHRLVRDGRFTDAQLYVDLHGFDPEQEPADPSEVLAAFLRQLGVPPAQVPTGRAERAAMFRDRLQDQAALVLLDNAADEEQVRDLVPGGPDCLVLVTSRRSLAGLDGADLYPLDVFTEQEALALLARIVGPQRTEAEPAASRAIAKACGYLPLALAIVAARLRARPAWSLDHFAERLERGLSELETGGRRLRHVFALSLRSLPNPLRALFHTLGLHPGADLTPDSVAALHGVDPARAEDLLERLVDEHLLQQPSPGRYALHDLLRVYAAELAAAAPPEARAAAQRRLADWYVDTVHRAALAIRTPELPEPGPCRWSGIATSFDSYDRALAWFDAEAANSGAVVRWLAACDLPDHVWRIALYQKGYFMLRWRLEEYVQSHALALAAGRALDDRYAQARALHGMGVAQSQLGRLDEAEPQLQAAVDLFRAIGERGLEVAALADIGLIHEARKDYRAALTAYDGALAVIGSADGKLRSRGVIRLNAGWFRHLLGDHAGARAQYEDAMADLRAADEIRGQVIVLGNLALLHRDTGDHASALSCFQQQFETSRSIGDEYFQAHSLMGSTLVLEALGRDAEARSFRERALTFARKAGMSEEEILARLNSTG